MPISAQHGPPVEVEKGGSRTVVLAVIWCVKMVSRLLAMASAITLLPRCTEFATVADQHCQPDACPGSLDPDHDLLWPREELLLALVASDASRSEVKSKGGRVQH
jgi:hypothetical protein